MNESQATQSAQTGKVVEPVNVKNRGRYQHPSIPGWHLPRIPMICAGCSRCNGVHSLTCPVAHRLIVQRKLADGESVELSAVARQLFDWWLPTTPRVQRVVTITGEAVYLEDEQEYLNPDGGSDSQNAKPNTKASVA